MSGIIEFKFTPSPIYWIKMERTMLDVSTVSPLMTVENISPALAQLWLAQSAGNRMLRRARVARYRKAMEAGEWVENGQAIIFSDTGVLLDGHHRLQACVEANVSFKSCVIRGVKDSSVVTLDTGRSRLAADVLEMIGATNTAAAAGAIRFILAIRLGMTAGNWSPENPEILAFYRENPTISVCVTSILGCRDILQPSIAAACYFLFSERDADATEAFFSDLTQGAGLAVDDPVLVLREGLLRTKLQKAKLPRIEIVARVIRAWNGRREGKSMKQIKGMIKGANGSLIFPEIL